MVSFKDLKNKRTDAMDKLNKKLESMNTKSYKSDDDDKYWRITKDNQGNGFAVIRFFFLAQDGSDELPHVKRWEHAFKGPGGWYIENSRTTLGYGEPDPAAEYNNKLWATNDPEKQKIVQKQKRKKYYFANILVVKDPAKPENDGKVFIFKFGQKIMDKILELQNPNPAFSDDEKIDPFDMWEGVNFRLNVCDVAGFPNYDKSKFDTRPSPIAETDEEIEAIWKQRHNLADLVAPKAFKSYDELKERLNKVLGTSNTKSNFETFDEEDEEEKAPEKNSSSKFDFSSLDEEDEPKETKKQASAPKSDDDDDLDFFKSLAN